MIEYFGHGFLPKKLLVWCLVIIIISKFQLWSGLRTSFAVLSLQDISICTFSYPLDIKWGTLLYPKTSVAPRWAPESFPGWVQPSHSSVACVVFFFFPLCSKSMNSPCPLQGAEPAVHLRSLLFECSCSQRRHPKPHPSESCWAWILSSMF